MAILHEETFICGRGKMAAVDFIEPEEMPLPEYPLILNTGRALYHFHTGSMTRRSRGLDQLLPGALVDMNPADAAVMGNAYGDTIRVTSRRGQIEAPAWLTDRCAVGGGRLTSLPFRGSGGQPFDQYRLRSGLQDS